MTSLFTYVLLINSAGVRVYGDLMKSLCACHLLVLRFVTNPTLLFIAKLTSTPGFFQTPLEAGILLDHPVEIQAGHWRIVENEKSEYLSPFFHPVVHLWQYLCPL